MDNVSSYYVAKQVEIRHSIDSEWPILLKQTLKYPHINTFPNVLNNNDNLSLYDSFTNINTLSNHNTKYLTNKESTQQTNNIINNTNEYLNSYSGSSQPLELSEIVSYSSNRANDQSLALLEPISRKIMTSYVTSNYTLGSNKKILSPSSEYECLAALKDVLHQLLYSKTLELETIVITSDFSGILKYNEAILTKCTNQFLIELKKMDIKIRTFYDLMEKEYKTTDLYRVTKNYSYLDSKKTMLNTLNLPNSPMYSINTLYIKGSNSTKFYNILLKQIKKSLEEDANFSFRVNYLITNFPILYGKLFNNKITFDNNVYFDGDSSRNFKKTILQGYLTPRKLRVLYSLLRDLDNMKALNIHEIKVSYDTNLLNDMHEKSLFIDNNRIFQSYIKNHSILETKYPWIYKYLSDLVPQTLFTLHKINTKLSIEDDLMFISNSPETEICYFYTHSIFESLVNQLATLVETSEFKIKVITNSFKPIENELEILNLAMVNLYNKWALKEEVYIPLLNPNEYISRLWLLHVLNDKIQLKRLLFKKHPLREISTFTYMVKNIRINQFYKFCSDHEKLDNVGCTYSHVDWSEISISNKDNYYELVTQQFSRVSVEIDSPFTVVVLCVGDLQNSLNWDNFNIVKNIFYFDNVLINPHHWDMVNHLNNPLSIDHIYTKLDQLDEFNISSFLHLFNINHDRCYEVIHTSQFDITLCKIDDLEILEDMKNSKIIPLCLSDHSYKDSEMIKKQLILNGFNVTDVVNMGWVYDCYHYGLIDYRNSLEIHRGVQNHKFLYWGWTFFTLDQNNSYNELELRKIYGIDVVNVDSIHNLSQIIYKHFINRLMEFNIYEDNLEFLGGDLIHTRYLIINSNNHRNYFTIKIANKLLVTLGSSQGISFIETPIEVLLVQT